ncbi:DUF2235 domain-containing protein [Mycolicibacterium moriokaense]|nr:DUF2235 domain-containing protein [Mycolicibacterium moriokaense]
MKSLVLCFDSTTNRPGPRDATNAEALFRLLVDDGERQLTWYDAGEASLNSPRMFNPAARRWRRSVTAAARESVTDAYFFLAEHWEPGDRIFLLGAGRGGYCARALARMLGTVGMMADREDHVVEYALAAYTLPGQGRTTEDWRQIHRVACALEGRTDVAVPVHFLGLWDTVKVPGTPPLCEEDWLRNVVTGRHAVAIDGGSGPFGECRIARGDDTIEEVWFRGAHCDVVGGPNAYWPLADLSLDWMLDGMVKAGALIGGRGTQRTPAPTDRDALAEGARSLRLRRLPEDALVHASVQVYVRAHPDYWRRLPWRFAWADADWAARAERLPSGAAAATETEPDPDGVSAVAS